MASSSAAKAGASGGSAASAVPGAKAASRAKHANRVNSASRVSPVSRVKVARAAKCATTASRARAANGMRRASLLFRHVSKNAAVNVITVISLTFITGLTASVFIETVFSLPGLSRMILANVAAREVIVVQSTVMLIIIFVIAVNLIVDLLYGLLDPRVRATR